MLGFYYPLYYLQLDVVSHNLDTTFAFYSVRILTCMVYARGH